MTDCPLHYLNLLSKAQGDKKDELHTILQENYPDINAPTDKMGRTVLMCAALNGHQVLMQPLLDHGANLYLRDNDGNSILSLSKTHPDLHEWVWNKCEQQLILAAKHGDLSTVQKSIEIGLDPGIKENDKYAWAPLHWACEGGHVGVVDYLLAHGVITDTECASKWTGLILSSRRGHLEIVRKLLEKGSNPNHLTNSGWSSLMWTAQEGHTEVAKLLLERGADITIKDQAGFTPFLQACQDGRLGIVRLLLEHNRDILDQKCPRNWSGVMLAAKGGHVDVIRYLAENGADMRYQKQDGVAALHIACYKGQANVVRFLCQDQQSINIQDEDGITPLMYAAKTGNLEIVQVLIEDGHADPNIYESDSDFTALFFAIESKSREVVQYLQRSGRVNLAHRTKMGHTAIRFAQFLGLQDLVNILSR